MRSIRRSEGRVGVLAFGVLSACAVALATLLPPIPDHPAFFGAGSTTPHHGGTFVFWHESDVHGLDPHVSYDELSGMALKLMFEGLIDYDDELHFVPRLARELPEVSEDGLVYTFRLRQGVHFHNGRELVAEDVRWSMEHMLHPDTHSPGVGFYELIAGLDEFRDRRAEHIRGIEVLDPLTVRFTLSRPDQTFMNAMAMMFAYPVPRESYEAHPDDVGRHPIGTGAYILETWEPGVRITFRRNPDFFIPGQPYCDHMVYELNLSRSSAFMRFVTADVDSIHRQSSTDYLWLRAQAAWRPYWVETPVLDMYGLVMNTELEPFTNVHVRRALSFAIDRERWQRAKQNRFLVNGLPLPPNMVPAGSTVTPQTYDLVRAREEMALAGHPVRQVGERWVAEGLEDQPIQLWLTEGDSGRVWGELAQQDLAAIGLEIEVRQVSFPIWLSETGHRRTAALLLGGWSADFPDPSNFLDVLFHSRSIHETASENRSFYHRAEVDDLLDSARVERDRSARATLYDQAMGVVVEDAPWAFILTDLKLYAWQPYVRNYRPHPVWDQMYRDVWLDLPRQRVASALRESGADSFAPAAPLGGTW
jgi:ABC-type transport system substrate-binding protein